MRRPISFWVGVASVLVVGCTAGAIEVLEPGHRRDGGAVKSDASALGCTRVGACESTVCDGEVCDAQGNVCAGGICRARSDAETVCDDGVDDDGDGLVDCEDPDCACPRVEIGAVQSVMSFGLEREAPIAGACPGGEVVVGFAGRSGQYLDALEPICAPLFVTRVDETRVQVRTGAHSVVPIPGGEGGSAFEEHCPVDMVVTRITGEFGSWVDAVSGRCEALFAQQDAEGWTIYGDGSAPLARQGGDGAGEVVDIGCTDGGFTQLEVEHADYGDGTTAYVEHVTAHCHHLRVLD